MGNLYFLAVVFLHFSHTLTQEIVNPPSVRVASSTFDYQSDLGIIPGVTSCGGPGRVLQWRYEACLVGDVPCRTRADSTIYRCEVDFIPSRDIASLGLRFKVESLDGKVKSEFTYPESIELSEKLRSGQKYTIKNAGGIGEHFRGKMSTFQYILYDKESNDVEVCAETEVFYW